MQEDKLCGMNAWQHCLLRGGLAERWQEELCSLEELAPLGGWGNLRHRWVGQRLG